MKLTLLLFVLVLVLQSVLGSDPVNPSTRDVTTATGQVRGHLIEFRGSHVYQFLGIPFAKPPLNELRFQRPVSVEPWDGVLSVTKWPPHCTQGLFPGFNSDYEKSEDCLTLNVFSSRQALDEVKKPRPVMVWIHGGGFAYGSAHADFYNGTALAALGDVVFVSINYRLGALGFLHLPDDGIEGNMGLWDQVLALQWIKDNIRNFGGDPDKVTIFGESAGSMSVSALILTPHSRGLFKNAIMQSGSVYNIDLWYEPMVSKVLLERTKCDTSTNKIDCLRAIESTDLVQDFGFLFWPVYGDTFLPASPDKLIESIDPNVNILLGVVGNEGVEMMAMLDPISYHPQNPTNMTMEEAKILLRKIYGPTSSSFYIERYMNGVNGDDPSEVRLAVASAFGDPTLTCPTYEFGYDVTKKATATVYAYYQSQKPSKAVFPTNKSSDWRPASHGDDIGMMFGAPLAQSGFNSEDVILSLSMMKVWTHFAKTGKTPSMASQKWSKWKLNESNDVVISVMELNSQRLGQINNQLADTCVQNWPFPAGKINMKIRKNPRS